MRVGAYGLPKINRQIHRPNLAWKPIRVVGMPVFVDTLRFNVVMPSKRFHEKVR